MTHLEISSLSGSDLTKLKRGHQRGSGIRGFHDRDWHAGPPVEWMQDYREMQDATYFKLEGYFKPEGSATS